MAPLTDVDSVVSDVSADLRTLYGDRLRRVVLFGSWARGDADPESDIDLLVVLAGPTNAWTERDRMDEIVWRHSFGNDAVISVIAVAEDEYVHRGSPFLRNVRREGRAVA